MRTLLIISFFLVIRMGYPQTFYPDSLKNALNIASNDSVRFMINKKISGFYFDRDRRKNFEFNEEALKIARKNNMHLDVVSCLEAKGYYLTKEDQYGEALKCFIEAFDLAESLANEKRSWLRPEDADPYQYRMEKLANLHHSLAHVLRGTGNNLEAIVHYRECIRYLAIALPTSFNTANMNIGAVYLDMNMLDSAFYYEKKALAGNHQTFRCFMLKYMGDIYLRQGENDSARYYYHKGIKSAIEQNNFSGLMNCQMGLAQYYIGENEKDSSLYYAREFLNGFNELHGNPGKDINISIAYELMFLAYQLRGQQDSTLNYLQLAFTSRDSISRAKILNLTQYQNLTFDEQIRLEKLEKEKLRTQNKIRIYSLLTGLAFILIVAFILYRNARQKQKANKKLEKTLADLKSTQSQLIQSEKMASLGELTAGIAHEIQNPLNFVNNFSEVNTELIDELKHELEKGELEEVKVIADDIAENEIKINHHGKRADAIVKGMLQHSRSSKGTKEPTDINILADEYLRLAYHGLKAKDRSFNADFKTDFDENLPKVNAVPQDIGRVLLNLINNAFYVVAEKKKYNRDDKGYKPSVSVSTKKVNDWVEIRVNDNGNGIPAEIKEKIFQPFFTTKPTGEGTGLGLSMSYDIITKGHGGELKVETKEGEGTSFFILIPIKSS